MLQGTAHDAVFSGAALPANPVAPSLRDPRAPIQCFCGSFTVDGDLAGRVLQSLPQVIVLDGLAEQPIEWLPELCGLVLRELGAIHSHSGQSLTNAELAGIAGMSVSSFADRFAQVMGQSPGAYLRGWRLDQAAEALLHSSAAIDAIADRVGYASKEAFSRAFHTRFGQTPSAWRLARQAGAAE